MGEEVLFNVFAMVLKLSPAVRNDLHISVATGTGCAASDRLQPSMFLIGWNY
jgi:hypothetical protein